MTPATLFDQLVRFLTYAGIPFEAYEDLSIRLLAPAPPIIRAALDLLHRING